MTKLYVSLVLGISVLTLVGCRKNQEKVTSTQGIYEYAFTLKRFSTLDTIISASMIKEKYKFLHSAKNELRRGYMCTFLVNGHIVSNRLLIQRKYLEQYQNSYTIYNFTDSDNQGTGYVHEGYITWGDQEVAHLQILDFPFPGWNRFIKTDE